MSKKLELFVNGLKSKRNEDWFFKVEKNWTGAVTYKMKAMPELTFRIEKGTKIKKDGSLEVSYMDFSKEAIMCNSGIKSWIYDKRFIDNVISTIEL